MTSDAVISGGSPVELVPYLDQPGRVKLQFAGDLISASGGCNRYGGARWRLVDGRLSVEGELSGTLLACPLAEARQDSWFVGFLLSSPSVSVDGPTVILTSSDTQVRMVDSAW